MAALRARAEAKLREPARDSALDEVEHARLVYGIASRFADRELGPGLLPAAILPMATELPVIVEALVTEGCVGETLGAAGPRRWRCERGLRRCARSS
ncbi:MAG: hypothetical protein U0359_08000 [Byssovorax sp.]